MSQARFDNRQKRAVLTRVIALLEQIAQTEQAAALRQGETKTLLAVLRDMAGDYATDDVFGGLR